MPRQRAEGDPRRSHEAEHPVRRISTSTSMTIPDFGSDLVAVALRSVLIYGFLIVGLRIGGKRDVGQLSVPDLAVLLVISNAVQNAMVGQNQSFAGGIVAGSAILAASKATQLLARRSTRLRDTLRGRRRVLYARGTPNTRVMAEERITMEELSAAFRAHGVFHHRLVRLAVLEVDGTISVIEHDEQPTGSRKGRRAGRLPRGSTSGEAARSA
jgi:uncharacterized membrane protein YcaP (DUF421 family)